MLGKLDAQFFPQIFGPRARSAARRRCSARRRSRSWRRRSATAARRRTSPTAAIRIAVENMANAIKKISVERGYDVTDYALNCFGSAGGQHACLIADTLGMETVLIHPLSGLLSAYGMGLAPMRASREQSLEVPLDDADHARIGKPSPGTSATRRPRSCSTRASSTTPSPSRLGCICATTAPTRRCRCSLSEPGFMRRDFETLHRQRFGFVSPEKRIVAAAHRGGGAVAAAQCEMSDAFSAPTANPRPATTHGGWRASTDTRFYSRRGVARGAGVAARDARAGADASPGRRWSSSRTRPSSSSPAGGWTVTAAQRLVLTRAAPAPARASRRRRRSGAAGGVQQPVHGHRRADGRGAAQHGAVGQHQGAARLLLRGVRRHRRARRQRPAHAGALGSMDRSVETIIRERGPEHAAGRRLHAQRAVQRRHASARHHRHHAGVRRRRRRGAVLRGEPRASRGYRRPDARLDDARAPPPSTRKASTSTTSSWSTAAASSRPRRARCCRRQISGAAIRDKNIADLKAQVAANAKGAAELRRMVAHFGLDVVQAYMRHVQDNAEESRAPADCRGSTTATSASRPTRARRSRCASPSIAPSARRRSISPAPARSSRTTSTRPSR